LAFFAVQIAVQVIRFYEAKATNVSVFHGDQAAFVWGAASFAEPA
jgi:hypothetical protein